MRELRAILLLHIKGHGKRTIAKSCGASKNTVVKYIEMYRQLGLDSEQVLQMDEKSLNDLFIQTRQEKPNVKLIEVRAFFLTYIRSCKKWVLCASCCGKNTKATPKRVYARAILRALQSLE